jgi:hypothetical protein
LSKGIELQDGPLQHVDVQDGEERVDDLDIILEELSRQGAGKKYGVGNTHFLEVEVFMEAEARGGLDDE